MISWNLSSTGNITGYNISVISNRKNATYYAPKNQQLLNLSSIANSSCDSINVIVSEANQSKAVACDIKDIYIRSGMPFATHAFLW